MQCKNVNKDMAYHHITFDFIFEASRDCPIRKLREFGVATSAVTSLVISTSEVFSISLVAHRQQDARNYDGWSSIDCHHLEQDNWH